MAKFRQGNLVLQFTQEIIQGGVTILDSNAILTNLTSIQMNLGVSVNEFSIDGTLAGDSDTAIPTEKAVKTNIDNNVSIINTRIDGVDTRIDNHEIDVDAHHNELHTIASHSDTSATGGQLDSLINNSIVDTLHRHSELVASDGSPDPALSITSSGNISTYGAIEVGGLNTGDRFAYVDFIGDETYTDYGLRVLRGNTGANAVSQMLHRGTGTFQIYTMDAAAIVLGTNNNPRVTISSTGVVTLKNGTGIDEFSTDGTLGGDSDDAVPTEKAVKTYVDAQVAVWG